ncbi:MAG: sigma-70 family RNA polymerase sigma factor [Candidatus Rokubacteria bacterium]|nr:sigma-70 family RNA polymerase sigma factor [Candidatus Rokubacteria bacterium]
MAERTDPMSDWELVQRARGGDREAFRQLVERYQRKVGALALGMLRNQDDALDVVQETFTKAYQSLDRFKGDSSFYTWVYRIASNLCIDHQRREARATHLPYENDDRTPGAIGEGTLLDGTPRDQPFDRTRDAQLGERLKIAIAELTPEHRAVILLREVDGLSYEEISQVLQCPKGTVMSRLHYARRQLQARLREML